MEERLGNLGEGIESATIVEVFVAEGDQITEGQNLIEVESAKAVMPIPAANAGKITKLLVSTGDEVSVGQVILEFEPTDGAAAPKEAAAPATPAPVAAPQMPVTAPAAAPVLAEPTGPMPTASPTVKRLAAQLQLDLRRVPSASPGGRIELPDLQRWLNHLIALASAPAGTGASTKPAPVAIPFEKWGPIRREKMTEIRKAISKAMVDSKNSQPHVTQFETVDITDLETLRKKHAKAWKEAGKPLTLTVLAVKAAVAALKEYPIFNASIDETTNEVVYKEYFHVGIAADTEHGLLVPIVRDADKKSLAEIAELIPQLAVKARDRKLHPDEMKGGTFTISNQGGIGGGHFTPVINRPEAGILGIGRGAMQPAVVDGNITPRLLLPLTVSYDHRIIDGGTAVRFTLCLIENLLSTSEDSLKLS
ncbi:MAG: branched-chain alpha-keto acid dehydrogenase subunit E2 [Verrucomicrobiales bacterium]|nr:branched-chain alpha-keto acid dehydrogenase subunit E2 [Verrucomicrobiales bacterium]